MEKLNSSVPPCASN